MMKNVLCMFLLMSMLVACAGHHTTSKTRQAFLKRVEQVALSSPRSLDDEAALPLAIMPGQWVTLFTRAKSGERMELGLTTYKVIKQEGNVTTIQIEIEVAQKEGVLLVNYEVVDFPSPTTLAPTRQEMELLSKNMRVKSAWVKEGTGPMTVLPKEALSKANELGRRSLSRFYRMGESKTLSCATTYLKSQTCTQYNYEGELAGRTGRGVVWAHAMVPIVHFIRSEDDKTVTEVVNFGLSNTSNLTQ